MTSSQLYQLPRRQDALINDLKTKIISNTQNGRHAGAFACACVENHITWTYSNIENLSLWSGSEKIGFVANECHGVLG
jgi:hypothetical protein